MEIIEELGNASKYKEQGEAFLTETNTTLEVVEAVPQKSPLWAKDQNHGIHYSVKLSNKNGSYTFDYWDSIANKEKVIKRKPNAYDILTSVNPDDSQDFAEFCANYGYDENSRTAEKTYNAVMEQSNNIRRLFSIDEIDALQYIQ